MESSPVLTSRYRDIVKQYPPSISLTPLWRQIGPLQGVKLTNTVMTHITNRPITVSQSINHLKKAETGGRYRMKRMSLALDLYENLSQSTLENSFEYNAYYIRTPKLPAE